MKNTAKTARKNESIVEILTAQLDQIFYPGYTEELIASDPVRFEWELKEFQGQFSRN